MMEEFSLEFVLFWLFLVWVVYLLIAIFIDAEIREKKQNKRKKHTNSDYIAEK